MRSPVSVVVAEIVMQNIEEQALTTYSETLPLWLRYVDDTITAVHENKIDEFHEHLNKQNTSIQFTKENEENGKILFLDCWVTRENNTLRTTVYRKPTHTDRLLDQTSYNPTSHKATTVRTLTRAQIVCDSDDSLTDANQVLGHCFYYEQLQISSKAKLTSDRKTALTTHTPLKPIDLTYEAPPKPWHAYYDLTTPELRRNPSSLYDALTH